MDGSQESPTTFVFSMFFKYDKSFKFYFSFFVQFGRSISMTLMRLSLFPFKPATLFPNITSVLLDSFFDFPLPLFIILDLFSNSFFFDLGEEGSLSLDTNICLVSSCLKNCSVACFHDKTDSWNVGKTLHDSKVEHPHEASSRVLHTYSNLHSNGHSIHSLNCSLLRAFWVSSVQAVYRSNQKNEMGQLVYMAVHCHQVPYLFLLVNLDHVLLHAPLGHLWTEIYFHNVCIQTQIAFHAV